MGDPLSQIPAGPLPVDLHTAVLRLLITEALVGSGRAARVERVQISPPTPGGRRVLITWTGRDRQSAASTRTVEGYVTV